MGIMTNSGGKGSGKRPLSVPKAMFDNNFDAIFGNKKPKNTVEENRILPEEHPLSKLLADVPEDLYLNNTWVRDVCEEANKVLAELDRLKSK
jgi:hypothetical protein